MALPSMKPAVVLLSCACGASDWTFADQDPALWLQTDENPDNELVPKRTVQIRPNGLRCAGCGALMSDRL